ncbi:hypothetical protein [Pseudomonas corrugata]|uniref:hypothetical protein n=1 Tax=Pseudomonas corrugata TaxID=47879 RepID=UPI0006D8C2DF|nr:hypothetical protein [Pseudomonas corrugata]
MNDLKFAVSAVMLALNLFYGYKLYGLINSVGWAFAITDDTSGFGILVAMSLALIWYMTRLVKKSRADEAK